MTRLVLALWLLPTVALAASSRPTSIPTTKPALTPNHALIVRNGKIIDGAGNAWFYGDILIRGGAIAAIGKIGPQKTPQSQRPPQNNGGGGGTGGSGAPPAQHPPQPGNEEKKP